MYVCVCNAVTERDIGEAATRGCAKLSDLRRELGVGECCGRCNSCARKVLRQSLSTAGRAAPSPVLQLVAA